MDGNIYQCIVPGVAESTVGILSVITYTSADIIISRTSTDKVTLINDKSTNSIIGITRSNGLQTSISTAMPTLAPLRTNTHRDTGWSYGKH